MITDHLSRWEKAAIFATGAGGAFNILLYQLGYTLADAVPGAGAIWWARVFFGIVSFVGFDLALVVTVIAMRQGRRSRWAAATIAAVIIAAGGIGLDVATVIALPVLHAAPVLVLAAFMLHLAAPRAGERVADLKAAVARLTAEAAQREQDVAQADARVADALARVAHAEAQAAQAAEDVARAEQDVARLRRELARRPQSDAEAWLTYNGQRVTLAQLVEATGTPSATLRRKLARVAEQTAQAAD